MIVNLASYVDDNCNSSVKLSFGTTPRVNLYYVISIGDASIVFSY